jgi:hypothetical protein
MLLTIEFGTESAQQQQRTMKIFFRVLALAALPVTLSFPTAVFTYWVTSNLFSLSQVLILKVPGLKQRFGIPDMVSLCCCTHTHTHIHTYIHTYIHTHTHTHTHIHSLIRARVVIQVQYPASATSSKGFWDEIKASYKASKDAQAMELEERSAMKKMEALSKIKVPREAPTASPPAAAATTAATTTAAAPASRALPEAKPLTLSSKILKNAKDA